MIRLLMRLIGILDYEPCKSCEILKQQLAIVNAEKKEAIDLLMDLAKPKPVVPYEPVKSVTAATGVFARRKAELENRDRKPAQAMRSDFASMSMVKPTESEVQETVEEIQREVEALENASQVR